MCVSYSVFLPILQSNYEPVFHQKPLGTVSAARVQTVLQVLRKSLKHLGVEGFPSIPSRLALPIPKIEQR